MTRKEADTLKKGMMVVKLNTIPQCRGRQYEFIGWNDKEHNEAIIQSAEGYRWPWSYRRLALANK